MSSPRGDRLDPEARVLGWFIALLPVHRREWGEAMRAELYHIGRGAARWTFVLGCGWVTIRTRVMDGGEMAAFGQRTRRAVGIAAAAGAVMVAPMAALSGASAGMAALRTLDAAFLFAVLWTLAATAVFMSGLLIASQGERSHRRWLVMLRVALLVLAAGGWLIISHDQMPCFLGEPNCD
jgi:hypothetical protein